MSRDPFAYSYLTNLPPGCTTKDIDRAWGDPHFDEEGINVCWWDNCEASTDFGRELCPEHEDMVTSWFATFAEQLAAAAWVQTVDDLLKEALMNGCMKWTHFYPLMQASSLLVYIRQVHGLEG